MSAGATEARALPYATTSYETDEDGTLYAVLPTRCVYATGEQTCTIFVDHYRERKTGPCYPVAVVGCRRHEGGRRYTLYPPGHYPYGRVAVVAYSAGGELQLDADGRPQWQATLFAAAQDAAQGRIWADEQHWWQSLAGGLRRTQGRHLETAARLTGVSGELEAREREQIATRLGVATMTVLAEARRWRRGWKSRGAAIVAVLAALVSSATLGDRMGAAGAVSDLWGPPRPRLVARWEQTGNSWKVLASGRSRAREQGVVGALRGRGPPPRERSLESARAALQ